MGEATDAADSVTTSAPSPSRRDDTGVNRHHILEAAIAIIEERGEPAVRVAEVAARADVRHPSIYHYFTNRDGLIVAAQAERYRRAISYSNAPLAAMLAAARTRDEFIHAVDVTIRSFSDRAGIARRRVRREVLGSAVFRPELARLVDAMVDQQVADLVRIFSDSRGADWVDGPYDLDAVMFWWLGTIQGRQFVDDRDDERLSGQWDDIVAREVLRALFGSDAARDPDPPLRTKFGVPTSRSSI